MEKTPTTENTKLTNENLGKDAKAELGRDLLGVFVRHERLPEQREFSYLITLATTWGLPALPGG